MPSRSELEAGGSMNRAIRKMTHWYWNKERCSTCLMCVPLLASDGCVEMASDAWERLNLELTWESLRRSVAGSRWLSQVLWGTTYLVPLCHVAPRLFLVLMWLQPCCRLWGASCLFLSFFLSSISLLPTSSNIIPFAALRYPAAEGVHPQGGRLQFQLKFLTKDCQPNPVDNGWSSE